MKAAQVQNTIDALRRTCASIDIDVLTGADALRLMKMFSSAEAMCSSTKTALAGRVERANAHSGTGHRDAASLVAAETGCSRTSASDLLQTAKELEECPETAVRFANGELSSGQAAAVASGAAASPSSEADLLETAQRDSLDALQRQARSAVAASRSAVQQEQDAQRRRARRYLRFDPSGDMTRVHGLLTNEDAARALAVLQPLAKKAFMDACSAGRKEGAGAYMADALTEALVGSSSEKAPAKANVNVLVDYETIRRGFLEDGERCEVPGVGVVSVRFAKEMADDCWLNVLYRKGGYVVGVGSESRYIPKAVRRSVAIGGSTCSVRGCDNTLGLQIDHRQERRDKGKSQYGNLAPLCPYHHQLKTAGKIELLGETGDYIVQWIGDRPPRQKGPRTDALF